MMKAEELEQTIKERDKLLDEIIKERNDWMKACKGYKQDLEQVQRDRDALLKEIERLKLRTTEMAAEDCAKMERLWKENNRLKDVARDAGRWSNETRA